MSELPAEMEIEYSYVRVRILKCDTPTFWYADKVGQIVDAQKRTYVRNGEIEHVNYWASPDDKKNDWRGGLPLEVEEV